MSALTPDEIWAALEEVKDPEIPVVSIVDLGMVREVQVKDGTVYVALTPTFSGCPALHVLHDLVQECLLKHGAERVAVRWQLDPAWTSDWIDEPARARLKAFGLAPPPIHHGQFALLSLELAACPYCGSDDTEVKNAFGPTLCRAIHYCHACRQPFEQFKPI